MPLLDRLREPAEQIARAVKGSLEDLAHGLPRESYRKALFADARVLARVAPKLLPWLVRTRGEAHETLLTVVLDHAREAPDALALEMGDERLTYRDLDVLSSRVARVLRDKGVRPGEVVALMGPNSPFYMAAILGATRVGAVTALINTHLEGQPLAHAVRTSKARVALVHARFDERLRPAAPELEHTLVYGEGKGELDAMLARASSAPYPPERVTTGSDFVYIYTSGTTGLPKPSRVSHGRALLGAAAFAEGMWAFQPGDKVYCVLPLYHSSGLLLGVAAALVGRVPVALRESFSARNFWPDVVRYGATGMLYIGEICRHLLNTAPCDEERRHHLRIAVGNGMRADVWGPFQRRFGIADVREFYAATEAPGILVNAQNHVGSIGRLPARHFLPMRLVRYDVDEDRHVRDGEGRCIECRPGEVGELIVKLSDRPLSPTFEFKGYTDPEATARKILTDVFRPGDRFYRSGDLMRMDDDGFFYFVDRIGDTFRWKGENVSTLEVAEVLGKAPGVKEIAVLGVKVPGMEGQAGLAAVVTEGPLDLEGFWLAAQGLPAYAQPRFVRVVNALEVTSTHKIQKMALRAQGADPAKGEGPVYLRTDAAYVPLTASLWADVCEGRARL